MDIIYSLFEKSEYITNQQRKFIFCLVRQIYEASEANKKDIFGKNLDAYKDIEDIKKFGYFKEFQELHGVHITKPEKEIVLGVYHDKNGDIIRRKIDDNGVYLESNKDYIERIKDTSEEYWNVKKITDWIDSGDRKGKVMFKDVGDDYSPERIEI